MKKAFLIFYTLIVTSNTISAESDSKRGNLFIEATYSEGFKYPKAKLNRIDDSVMDKENNLYTQPDVIGYYTYNYGTTAEKVASVYVFDHSPKPKLFGQTTSLLFEYVMKSTFGIGLSLNSSNFQASHLSYPKFDSLFDLGLIKNATPGFAGFSVDQLIGYEILLPYQTHHDNEFLKIRTANINFSYHFLKESNFDPYIRIAFGYGKEGVTDSKIYQSSLIIGTRYFMNNRLYLLCEVVGNNYDAYRVTNGTLKNILNEKNRHVWSLQEYSAKVGLGINF
ncbi:hypothetical protein [Leptospira yasudae]|uniref:hypothetical protein n=1 Tax=Leptospira yasudae TaxID=2202201 RepID=UPI001F4DF919|nr:hypothetical protein [Leptospira yasudae]